MLQVACWVWPSAVCGALMLDLSGWFVCIVVMWCRHVDSATLAVVSTVVVCVEVKLFESASGAGVWFI